MVDYDHPTGEGGIMRIRDNGSRITFMLRAGYNDTFGYNKRYEWTVNGSSGSDTYSYVKGRDWLTLRSFTVTTNQTVRFYIAGTNTKGLGGPTTFNRAITRVTAPGVPRNLIFNAPPNSGFLLLGSWLSPTSNGGGAIIDYEVQWGRTNPPNTSVTRTNTGAFPVYVTDTGFYYARVRARNSAGYGPWTPVSSTFYSATPDQPTNPKLSNIGFTEMTFSMTPGGDGGVSIAAREYQMSVVPNFNNASTFQMSGNSVTRNDLPPGTRIYWRGRVINSNGPSPWSDVVDATTHPGVEVKVNGSWVSGIPYVKRGGVWVPGIPYVKRNNEWTLAR